MMKNLAHDKFYPLTVIGGGLTGQLMVSLLLKSNFIDSNKLCWINLDKKKIETSLICLVCPELR